MNYKTVCARKLVQAISFSFFVGCSVNTPVIDVTTSETESTTDSINELLSQAALFSGNQAFVLKLEAISELIENDLFERAKEEIGKINSSDSFELEAQLNFLLLNAQIAKAENQSQIALRWLENSIAKGVNPVSEIGRKILLLKGQTYLTLNQPELALFVFTEITESWPTESETSLFEDLWQSLQEIEGSRLSLIAEDSTSYELRGWIELTRIFRSEETSMKKQLDNIDQWRRTWVRHSAAIRLPQPLRDLQDSWNGRPLDVALILPILQPAGNAIYEGFLSAYYQELLASQEVPRVSIYDSSEVIDISEIYNKAVANGAELIIGPLKKSLVNQLQDYSELPINTLALNYADNPSSDNKLYQFGLAPEDEIREVINIAWEDGHRTAAILMPEDGDYQELQRFFENSWVQRGGKVVSRVNFHESSNYAEIVKMLMAIDSSEVRAEKLLNLLPRRNMEFTPRIRKDVDFIFLVANPNEGRQIKPTLAFYFAEDIPVYSIPSIYEGSENPTENRDLNGIIFADAPWVLGPTTELNRSTNEDLRQVTGPLRRLRAMGIDSFRLYPRLQQFSSGSIKIMEGATGQLFIDESQKFQRKLKAARFVEGIATRIER